MDFCNDCLISQLNSNSCHPLTHEFIPIHVAEPEMPEGGPGRNSLETETDHYIPIHIAEPVFETLDRTLRNSSEPGTSNFFNVKQEIKSENEDFSDSDSFSGSNYNYIVTTGYDSEDSHNMKDFDEDYVADMFASDNRKYNYLDPNFLPELYKSE